MSIKKYKPEQIVAVLRQIEVQIANGKTAPQACKEAGIHTQTYYRWRKEYGGVVNRRGKPLDPKNLLNRHLAPVCKRLGLPRISWHSFRHCNATLLDAVGAPLGTVPALLGHASSEVTRSIYLHAIPGEQRRAVVKLEKLIFGPQWTQIAGDQENTGLLTA